MSPQEHSSFLALRKQVESTFVEGHPHCILPIDQWKGQWIVDFQEDLLAKVQGRVSEKWFYTWFRQGEIGKLPRIDMLNLLSRYAGSENWADFISKTPHPPASEKKQLSPSYRKWWLGFGAASVAILLATLLLGFGNGKVKYELNFLDAFTRSPLEYAPDASYQRDGEKWKALSLVESQTHLVGRSGEKVKLAVSGGYCQTDTINLKLPEEEGAIEILVQPDDYAIMIHIFSRSDIKDWRARREKLNRMVAEEAEIFQVDPLDQLGMEMYNKEEFINQLTMPVQGLKDIQILETRRNLEGKIQSLRFTRGSLE